MGFLLRLCLPALAVSLSVGISAYAQTPSALPQTEARTVRLEGPAPAVLEQLGQLYGVRLRVDPDFPRASVRLRLEEADFAAALRVAAHLTGAFWVLQPDGIVFVAEDTPAKRARLQPQVVQSFVLPGRTPEELSEATRLLREVLDMRRIRQEPASSTLTVRDTPFRLAVAARLLDQVIAPDPGEVWLEVTLLEVDRERALDFGLLPPDQFIIVHLGAGALAARQADNLQDVVQFLLDRNLLPPALSEQIRIDIAQQQVTFPPFVLFGGGETTFAANLPGATLTFRELRRTVETARRFSLRARENEEATLFAGERFPVTFTTFSSIFIPEVVQELIEQGEFVPPVPAIRYEELGTRITAVPRLHSDDELSLRLTLMQQTLTGNDLNGIPILSNREVEEHVRLKEGETLLLGGLRTQEEETIRTQTPLLGSAPLIGHLFKRSRPRTRSTELIMLVTPRIIRSPVPARADLRTLYVGTESDFAPAGGPAAPPSRQPTPPGRQPEQQ